ncbi:MAG: stage 0 sporulation family protein [Eggerthella lenta]
MVRIAPINLYYNPKTLWFDAGDLDVRAGDGVIVSTARGTEFGRAAHDVFEADEAQIKKLKSPLKPVKRIATDEDEARAAELEAKSREALPVFKEMAAEGNGDMHPVSVEYLFEGDKAIFYFEAEERVDFRELVRKLAAHFRVRIDMRQIGVRDEARMVGGLGHCGQELCCKRLGGEFCPVSIRMAKEQDLSLNPQKISGVCGRLMCCLRYEFDAYKDFKSRAPKQNATVETPDGPAKVVDLDVPREIVSLKIMGEKPVKVPLADFDPPEEGSNRPNRVGEEAWQDATTADPIGFAGESALFGTTTQLTGRTSWPIRSVRRTAAAVRSRRRAAARTAAARAAARKGRRQRRPEGRKQADAQAQSARKPRRRRSTKVGGEGAAAPRRPRRRSASRSSKAAARRRAAGRPAAEAPVGSGRSSGNGGSKRVGSAREARARRGRRACSPRSLVPARSPQACAMASGSRARTRRPAPSARGLRAARAAARRETAGIAVPRRRSHKAGGSDGAGAPGAGGARRRAANSGRTEEAHRE